MILFDHVSFEYEKGAKILDDISFEIKDGESVGLIGANGAGKSTLMKVMLGLLPHSGKIFIDDIEVTKATLKDVRKKLGLVLQNSDHQMFMPTVLEDIMFAPLNFGMSKKEAEERADEVLNELGLAELKYRHNHKLSGGEKKMAAIATVLAMRPDTLLMDEPTASLDPYHRRIVIKMINNLPNTKLITSHNLEMVKNTCKRVILLSKGKIAADGGAESIIGNHELLEANRM